jgi:hypothetical protein
VDDGPKARTVKCDDTPCLACMGENTPESIKEWAFRSSSVDIHDQISTGYEDLREDLIWQAGDGREAVSLAQQPYGLRSEMNYLLVQTRAKDVVLLGEHGWWLLQW